MIAEGITCFHSFLIIDVNPADFQGEATPLNELRFEVKFAGMDTVLVQDDRDILHSGIQGNLNLLYPTEVCKPPLPLLLFSSIHNPD